MIDGRKAVIIITECGVSVDFRCGPKAGGSIHTNIVPKSLSWDQLIHILGVIEKTDIEGSFY